MTIPVFTQKEFLAYLKDYGFEPVCADYFDQFDRIILENSDKTCNFPIQLAAKYFYPVVVRTCLSLNIPAPEEHLRCYNQRPPKQSKN